MENNTLSLFIDESGDFGSLEEHSPYYIVAFVFHDQNFSIHDDIRFLDENLKKIGCGKYTVHTGPLIRGEGVYKGNDINKRKQILSAFFRFIQKINVHYTYVLVDKRISNNQIALIQELSNKINNICDKLNNYILKYNQLILYYDKGQIELTKILTSVFTTKYGNKIEFRKISPEKYKNFQIADFICTFALVQKKIENGKMSKSEQKFFGNEENFQKKYADILLRKRIDMSK